MVYVGTIMYNQIIIICHTLLYYAFSSFSNYYYSFEPLYYLVDKQVVIFFIKKHNIFCLYILFNVTQTGYRVSCVKHLDDLVDPGNNDMLLLASRGSQIT